jgi:murein L,D-transpeptidase YafK
MHIPIEIFPARFTREGLDHLAATRRSEPDLVLFWRNLKEGYDYFEKTAGRRLFPSIGVDVTYS